MSRSSAEGCTVRGGVVICSYLRNFIFIKTKKTGGTTMEMVLARSCGPQDIITPITAGEERLRMMDGRILCRNYARVPEREEEFRQAVLADNRKRAREVARAMKANDERVFRNHMTAQEIKAAVPGEVWDRAFKFTIDRHPYERVVSKAYFQFDARNGMTFQEFLDDIIKRGRYSSFDYFAIGGKPVVDYVARLESIEADLKHLGDRLGIAIPADLPRQRATAGRTGVRRGRY
jgi:hypothetical protein